MGKHEKPTEKNILDTACEIDEAIKGLDNKGVLGFTSIGIHLYSKTFKANFKEYRTTPTDGGTFLFADYNGHQFVAFVKEGEE